jgi:SAM-dependent methyltransferase
MPGRSTCRSCGSSDLMTFLQLGDLPHSDGLLREEDLDGSEPRYPLDVVFCGSCTLVQILETVPPDQLFPDDYPYFSSFSDALLAHSSENVEQLLASRELNDGSLVVELASNDGYLLQYYVGHGIPVLGIDPARGPVEAAREKGVPTLHRFFTLELARQLSVEGRRADVIHANNVLAHVADTNGFVAGVRALLKDDGLAVIEVPYVKDLIDHREFDTIYHEHLCYFSVTALVGLFKRHGLSLNHVERLTIHGGSLRLFVEPAERMRDSVGDCLRSEEECGLTGPDYYRDFSARVAEVKRDLGALLRELKDQGKRLAGYGAAAKGAILLNYVGIGTETLDWIADRNLHKQGRFMPGVHIPIVDPDRLLKDMPDYVLILPWNFKDEIMRQQAEYAERGGRFIVPIPSPRIL